MHQQGKLVLAIMDNLVLRGVDLTLDRPLQALSQALLMVDLDHLALSDLDPCVVFK